MFDLMKGIETNQDKFDFHLQKLEQLGIADQKQFVFTEVPYTKESSTRIWHSAYTNFPDAITFTCNYYATDDTRYGVNPYVLTVWDLPSEMNR